MPADTALTHVAIAKLDAIATSTSTAITRYFLAGGMMIATNKPYRLTLSALTSRAGSTSPITTPK